MHRIISALIIPAVAVCLLTACGKDTSSYDSSTNTNEQPAWLLVDAPENPSDIGQIKETAKAGDEVVLRGVIGGRIDALSTNSALFVLVDIGVENVCTSGDDHCATPWDYCCATPEVLTANNATVQLVDDSGSTITIDLRSKGIAPLDTVIIAGVVGPRPTGDVLMVKATSIYKAP